MKCTATRINIIFLALFFSAFVRPDLSDIALDRRSIAKPGLAKSEELRDRAAHLYTIMINPGGEAKNKGRIIEDAFEESITFALAHALKNQIEQYIPHARVILTRTANEGVRPLQNANFANRLDVDLFLSLHCVQENLTRPQLAIYTFAYEANNPIRLPDLAFYTYDQAHLRNQNKTENYAHALENALKKNNTQFDCLTVSSVPFKPLIGIKAPAIGIEIGLKNKQSWQQFLAPLLEAIIELVRSTP